MHSKQLTWVTCPIGHYETTYQFMKQYTDERHADTHDIILLVEHHPVITIGPTTQEEHIKDNLEIPVYKTNRGGKATYHGPGQLIIYPLLDLKRLGLKPSLLIQLLEETMIACCRVFNIEAVSNPAARGVYIGGKKIGSIGLRISKGCSYHGASFNVNMDLKPFEKIVTCGMFDLEMTQLAHFKNCHISTIKTIYHDIFMQKINQHTSFTLQSRKITLETFSSLNTLRLSHGS